MDFVMQLAVFTLILLFFVSFSLFIRRLIVNSNYQKHKVMKLEKELYELKQLVVYLQRNKTYLSLRFF